MDIKRDITYRNEFFTSFNNALNSNKYDYAKEGVLNKCLPKILFKGNPILVSFIQLIDVKIIMLLNYVDSIKCYKHITKF